MSTVSEKQTVASTDAATTAVPKARIPRRPRPEKAHDRRDAGQPRATGGVPAQNDMLISGPRPDHDAVVVGAALSEEPVAAKVSAETQELHPCDVLGGAEPDISATGIEEASHREARLSPEMRNAFMRFRSSKMAIRSSASALAMGKLMRTRLPYPRQIEGMGELEELRLLGLEMQGEQQLALTIFERSGCGKSTLAQQYKLMRNMEKPNSVLHARMGTSGTARDLWVSVMSELGDGFASAGNEHSLRRRAMKGLEDAGVELLILDETQHSGQRTGFSSDVTAELKIMLDTGKVPIVLMGTEKAVPLIKADRELAGRMFSPCRLSPLEMTDDDDFELWCDFLQDLDARMVAENILAQPFGFDREEVAEALGEITEGIIGQLMRVMLMAVRDMVRDGRQVMEMVDLINSVDEWSNELGFASSNPLRDI